MRVCVTSQDLQCVQELSSCWDGRPIGHSRHGQKRRGYCVPLFVGGGEAGSPSNKMLSGLRTTAVARNKWHLDPSSRLAITAIGKKLGRYDVLVLGEMSPHLTQCGLGRGLPLYAYQVASWSIKPCGNNRHGPKSGGLLCQFISGGGKLGPHLTQCRLGQGLPPYKVASSSIMPFSTTDIGQKLGRDAVPLLGDGSASNTMWRAPRPITIPSGILIHPTVWP